MGKGPNDYGAGRKHLIAACEESLRKLKTDYIDLYIIHVVDPNTPLEELLYTFDILVRQGKVRYAGTSKHPATLIVEGVLTSKKYGWPAFISEQPPYNLLDRTPENELIPACKKTRGWNNSFLSPRKRDTLRKIPPEQRAARGRQDVEKDSRPG